MDIEALDTSGFESGEQGADEAAAVAVSNGAEPQVEEAPQEADPNVNDEAPEEAPDTAEQPKAKKTAQERIDEITRARRDAEREAKYWRDVAEGKLKPQNQQERQDAAPEAPNPHDFDLGETDPDYIKAVISHEVKKGLDEAKSNMAQNMHQQAQERVWEVAQEAARSKFADYDAKVIDGAANWPCTQEMARAIRTSDVGGDVAYHLASNPEEARRIASLDPFSQVRELGRIEARLETPATPQSPPAKTATTAPKPPENQARGAGGQFSVAPDTDDFAAFEKAFAPRFN